MFAGAVPSAVVKAWGGLSSPVPSARCPQLRPLPVRRLSGDSSVGNLSFPSQQTGPLGYLLFEFISNFQINILVKN